MRSDGAYRQRKPVVESDDWRMANNLTSFPEPALAPGPAEGYCFSLPHCSIGILHGHTIPSGSLQPFLSSAGTDPLGLGNKRLRFCNKCCAGDITRHSYWIQRNSGCRGLSVFPYCSGFFIQTEEKILLPAMTRIRSISHNRPHKCKLNLDGLAKSMKKGVIQSQRLYSLEGCLPPPKGEIYLQLIC